MIELIDERESVPEEVADFELEFIMICFSETLTDFRNLIFRSIDVVFI